MTSSNTTQTPQPKKNNAQIKGNRPSKAIMIAAMALVIALISLVFSIKRYHATSVVMPIPVSPIGTSQEYSQLQQQINALKVKKSPKQNTALIYLTLAKLMKTQPEVQRALLRHAKKQSRDPKTKQKIEQQIRTIPLEKRSAIRKRFLALAALRDAITALALPIQMTKPTKPVETKPSPSRWDSAARVLRQFFIVRRLPAREVVAIMPSEKQRLINNAQVNIGFAQWGLLNQDPNSYRLGLTRTHDLIQRYFSHQPAAKKILASLKALLTHSEIKPSSTLMTEQVSP